eukprot:GILI01009689.1.p1 GENE.GILI01009689.1~~GILI01009689.1.p1  ORF type:complete len:623 (+),score=126.06 GILI01009689.1:60-1928(+)
MSSVGKFADFNRGEFEDTCRRRFFFGPAFEPYGGTAGLYDLGPPMCAMKSNFLSYWRQHFVLEENMCEIDTTNLTPDNVFIASGHVARFNDVMVRDTVTGECIRADKLIEELCEAATADKATPEDKKKEFAHLRIIAGGLNKDQIAEEIAKHGFKSTKGNPLSEPFPFNLMFKSMIGPDGSKVGYMRPELAQGIILNFKRLMDSGNAQRLPFAGACIGTAFRNEIAPRAALIRVREFTLAEIEHFVNPSDKSHPSFKRVADVQFACWSRDLQVGGQEPTIMTIGEAVAKKIIDNQTLGYFIGRVKLFMDAIGIKDMRFRQHLSDEMAHYAQDCWDCELLTSYGYVECVGIADRSAYDLECHSKGSGKDLVAREEFATPIVSRVFKAKVNKAIFGKKYGKDAGEALKFFEGLSDEAARKLGKDLEAGSATVTLANGNSIDVTADVVTFSEQDVKITGRNFTPNVIEPSFGVGRILYSLLEQSYWVRRDDTGKNDKRGVFSLTPLLAPQKVAVLPLMVKPELEELIESLRKNLVLAGLSTRTDDSGAAIGKKYARIDELGIPFCITCDFENDGAVTLRERDTAGQVRVPITEVVEVVSKLCNPLVPMKWAEVASKYPEQAAKKE